MNLHAAIMNIPRAPIMLNPQPAVAYDQGHRDARHAAAELALKADAINAELLAALKALSFAFEASIHDHEDSGAWLAARAAIAAWLAARAAIAAATGEKA